MIVRGKAKLILESSIDAALLGVEVYNKPRTSFRSQNFIILMIIAWTHLFHAYFRKTIGDKYYYKHKGKYEIINGERKAWELSTCIDKFGKLNKSVETNLRFFIELRNKIEHRTTLSSEIDTLIFGECQSLLYNYEFLLQDFFGSNYALHENLVFSLQFSRLRGAEQNLSVKTALSHEMQDITSYISKYRNDITDEVYNSQEFSVKLICVPRISNTNRHDLAIEFIKWSDLSEEDRKKYTKVNAIIKERVVEKEVIKSIRVVEKNGDTSSSPLIVSVTDPEYATATLVHETLSTNIFDDVNKIIQANEILSQDNKSFKFDQTIYYRVYAQRKKLHQNDQNQKLLALTGLRLNTPCLFWFKSLSDKVVAEVLKDFTEIPRYHNMKIAMMVSILLGTSACDWIEEKIKRVPKVYLTDNRLLNIFKKMRNLIEKDDVRLAAIQERRSARIPLPDKTKFKLSDVIDDSTKAEEYLTEFCQKAADGCKEYRYICRLLDVLAYGKEIQNRNYKITKYLCV